MFQKEKITITESIHTYLLDCEGTIFLDSTFFDKEEGFFSIYAVDPFIKLKANVDYCECVGAKGEQWKEFLDPFRVVEKLVKKSSEYPFEWCGFNAGFVGMYSYEAAQVFDDFKQCIHSSDYPLMLGGIYDRFILLNHKENTAYFICTTLYDRPIIRFESLLNNHVQANLNSDLLKKTKQSIKRISFSEYEKQFNKAKSYIKNGDIYQINYSVRYSVAQLDESASIYAQLRKSSPAPYGAYLNCFGFQIMCNSPELFFQKKSLNIQTRPIKGTIKRGDTCDEDKEKKSQLIHSKKDHAELTMITDLERNDLNRICKVDSVKVDSLREIKAFKYLYHTYSIIKGVLKENYGLYEIMKNLFPGGSITGAPKLRSMEIINQLEPGPRGPYTGSIGFASCSNDMLFNIAIRTMYTEKNELVFHAGGALVSDSDAKKEFDECQLKSKAFLMALDAK